MSSLARNDPSWKKVTWTCGFPCRTIIQPNTMRSWCHGIIKVINGDYDSFRFKWFKSDHSRMKCSSHHVVHNLTLVVPNSTAWWLNPSESETYLWLGIAILGEQNETSSNHQSDQVFALNIFYLAQKSNAIAEIGPPNLGVPARICGVITCTWPKYIHITNNMYIV